jgi:hemerythrin
MQSPGSLNHCFKKSFNTEAVPVPLSRHRQAHPTIPNEVNNVQNQKAKPTDNWVQNLTG